MDTAISSVTPQPQSPLLALAAEIRNAIYHYALAPNGGKRLKLTHLAEPALTITCRQIQAEALPIFFASNKFSLTDHTAGSFVSQERLISVSTMAWLDRAKGHDSHITDVEIESVRMRPNSCPILDARYVVHMDSDRLVLAQTHTWQGAFNFEKPTVEAAEAQTYLDRLAESKDRESEAVGLGVDDVVNLARLLR